MLSAAVERDVQASPALASAKFGISAAHAAHIMGILRSTLYTRKALALLREYGSNGWDEHRQAGIPARPIKVTLPTVFQPTLRIRDYGRGLSEEAVLHYYTQYGESSKRDTNEVTGFLGIGCKAGFAYADSFTVISWHDGTKSVYNAALDKSNCGQMDKIHETPCGDETGVEIVVAVKPKDVDEFRREAQYLFRYFNPQPVINIPLEPPPQGTQAGFIIENFHNEWIAVMGCVPYRLDTKQMEEAIAEAGLSSVLNHLSGGVYLPMGTVEFSASREELQYTDKTIKAIIAQFHLLLDEYTNDALKLLKSGTPLTWEARVKLNFLFRTLKVKPPEAFAKYAESCHHVALFDQASPPKSFTLHSSEYGHTTRIHVVNDTHILIKDNAGSSLRSWKCNKAADVIAVPREGFTYQQVKDEIEALAVSAGIVGIPISPLSSRAWLSSHSSGRGGRDANPKHFKRTFLLADQIVDSVPRSASWKAATPPDDEHVFVIISEFCPVGITLHNLAEDKSMFTAFGVPWPAIYGYKTTSKRHVSEKDIEKGVPYKDWKRKAIQSLLTDQRKQEVESLWWGNMIGDYRYARNRGVSIQALSDHITKALGPDHMISTFFRKVFEGVELRKGLSAGYINTLHRLTPYMDWDPQGNALQMMEDLTRTYPMFRTCTSRLEDIVLTVSEHLGTIVEYIQVIDRAQGSIPAPVA